MKSEKILFFIAVSFIFVSCKSTKLLYNGNAAAEVRSDLSELQSQQSETAITSERITAASGNIENGLQDVASELTDRESDSTDFEQILARIREQKLPE